MLSEREARLRTRTLGWGSVAVLLISLFVFGLSTQVFYLALVIPWIAAFVYRQGQGVIHLWVGKGDPRPNVTHVYGFSLMLPGISTVMEPTGSLRWDLLILIGLVIGTLLAAVAIADRHSWPRVEILFLLAGNSFYGLGVAKAINQDLDSGTPQTHAARVLEKRIGSSARNIYFLKLGPWGPRVNSKDVWVSKQVYDRVSVGGTVCVELHPGALRIPWFQTQTCGANARGPQQGHSSIVY